MICHTAKDTSNRKDRMNMENKNDLGYKMVGWGKITPEIKEWKIGISDLNLPYNY